MEKIKKILLIASLIGIMILLFVSQQISPKISSISQLNESQLGERVQIKGSIVGIKDYSNNTFHVIELADSTGFISAIFNTKSKEIKINYSLNYTVIGKLETYNQTIQINAEKISLATSS